MRGNLTQEVGPSRSPGGQSPPHANTYTHKVAGRKHSQGGGSISGVCIKGWVRAWYPPFTGERK